VLSRLRKSPLLSGCVSAGVVWLMWAVYSDLDSLARVVFRPAVFGNSAPWVGTYERVLLFVNGVLVVLLPYGQAVMHGYDWLPVWPDTSFWVVALLLPVVFQVLYRFLCRRGSFHDGLLPGAMLACWIVLSLWVVPGQGPLWAIIFLDAPPLSRPTLISGIVDVMSHVLASAPYLVLWVTIGSSFVASSIYRSSITLSRTSASSRRPGALDSGER